jgi:hypothetical protein
MGIRAAVSVTVRQRDPIGNTFLLLNSRRSPFVPAPTGKDTKGLPLGCFQVAKLLAKSRSIWTAPDSAALSCEHELLEKEDFRAFRKRR